jgi:hypothetical protein
LTVDSAEVEVDMAVHSRYENWGITILLAVIAISPAAHAERPLVGAIRWDAWQESGKVKIAVEKALGPAQWHHRLPFFAKVNGPNSVAIDGNSQAVMDQEIGYAAKAGLDYWAFVAYPDDFGMSNGLHLYLSSPQKSRIRFCLNLQGGWISNPAKWDDEVKRYVKYFQDPSYQCVLGNRPLVYLFNGDAMIGKGKYADWAAARLAFDQLRAAAAEARVGKPYIVIQGWNAKQDRTMQSEIGADALGAYAVAGGSRSGDAFEALAAKAHAFWDAGKATGSDVVPIVTSGWDNRPRVENPPPWTKGSENHYLVPTPTEMARHLTDAQDWTRSNVAAAPAQTVLIYAWNEHDEGGWLCPTLKPDGMTADTSRLEAIEAVLKQPVP